MMSNFGHRIGVGGKEMSKIKNSILGLAIGDALGVPVEFKSREVLDRDPVIGMRGYGTHHQPIGTWSDDTSLTLATMDGIVHGDDASGIMKRFCNWLYKGKYTAHDEVFDVGNTTGIAIRRFRDNPGIVPCSCGLVTSESNGNGSLMRILPIALAHVKSDDDMIIKMGMEGSSWTHGHMTSKLCCAYYCLVVAKLYNGFSIEESFELANEAIRCRFNGLSDLEGIFDSREVPRAYIRSTGYVVHGLEVARWCMSNSSSYSEAVLKAINLGDDTDTNGAIVGGLAGLYFGNIPDEWLEQLQSRSRIIKLINRFERSIYG